MLGSVSNVVGPLLSYTKQHEVADVVNWCNIIKIKKTSSCHLKMAPKWSPIPYTLMVKCSASVYLQNNVCKIQFGQFLSVWTVSALITNFSRAIYFF